MNTLITKESYNEALKRNEELKKDCDGRTIKISTLETEVEDMKAVIAKLTDARVILNKYFSTHFENFTEDEKKEIVVEFASRKESGDEVANKYDVSRETIYKWQRNFIGSSHKEKFNKDAYKYKDLVKENEKLLLENKILKTSYNLNKIL